MKRHFPAVSAVSFLAMLACACAQPRVESPTPGSTGRVVGYYFGPTARRGFPVAKINGEQLTHINYAFGEILADGTPALANPAIDSANFAELFQLKQRFPHLQVLISFGGWSGSKYFSEAAATAESRARFIEGVMSIFIRPFPGVFDGIDLDWEYPVRGGVAGIISRPEDRENLTSLVIEARRALAAETPGKHYLVTIAAPAGAGHLVKYEMSKLGELLDFINLMTYDFHTASSRIAHFNSPLGSASDDPTPDYNIEASIKAFLAAGVPRTKLLVGTPFYGYGYGGVAGKGHGRFQPVEGVRADSAGARPKWVGRVRPDQIDEALREGFERHWDRKAHVPWLYNAATRVWITYDDVRSTGDKAAFVRENKLGGIMIWELSGDDGTLLPEINRQLRR